MRRSSGGVAGWRVLAILLIISSARAWATAPDGLFELKITSPLPGSVVIAGSTITVDVASASGVAVENVLVVGVDQAADSSQAPFRVFFEIPLEAFGPYEITAFGRGSGADAFYHSASVMLHVKTDATLESLKIPATSFVFDTESRTLFVGESEQLSVRGRFSDGVERAIPLNEVTWSSAAPTVFKVDSAGVVTGIAPGKADVAAKALGLECSIEMVVIAERQ